MPVYVIADITVHDPEVYAQYAAASPATVAAHGGRYWARSRDIERLEGDWVPERAAILEFPDVESLRAWFDSPEYVALRRLRQHAATVRLIALAGVALFLKPST